mgnify:CR=1 FL=1
MKYMNKILFIGDIHLSEIGPQSRKDDYMQSIIDKINECFEISRRKMCDAVIFMGDIFDVMEPSGKCRNIILKLLLENNDIEKYVIVGNHDVKNHIENVYRSALGTLISAGALLYTNYIDKHKIQLYDYYVGIEDDIRNGMFVNNNSNYPLVIAVHASITDSTRPYNHVIFNQIQLPNSCKLLVGGHIHEEMHQINENGQFFINPASLCRNKLDNYNIHRNIYVLYAEYDDIDIKTELIQLKKVRPSNEIFDIESKQRHTQAKNETSQFIKQIFSYKSITTNEDKYESLRKSAKIKNIDEDVVELAISTLINVNDRRTK